MSGYLKTLKSSRSHSDLRCLLVHDGSPIMASGMPALARLLRDRGIACELRNLDSERRGGAADDFGRTVGDFDILGISMHWFYQIPAALEAAARARKASDNIFIVAGGFTAAFFADEIVRTQGDIDAVIRGDAEAPLVMLCDELAKKKPSLTNVPNLVFRGSGGRAVRSRAPVYAATAKMLDLLDFGDMSCLRNPALYRKYSSWREITDGSSDIGFDIDSTFYMCGGRGCSVQCMACGGGRKSHAIHSMRKGAHLFRSPERIADDAQEAVGAGYGSIHACFDPVPDGKHWFDFMKQMRKRRIRTNLIFECFGLPSKKFLRAVRETFENAVIVLSPETSVDSARKKSRGFYFTSRQLTTCLEWIGREGLSAQVFFAYFQPGESEKTVNRNLDFIDGLLSAHGGFAHVFYYPCSTDPCSPVSLQPEKLGMTCEIGSFQDYRRELAWGDRLRGNLQRHFPEGRSRRYWDILALRIELETACRRHGPRNADTIRSKLGDRTGDFYMELAKKISEGRDITLIERGSLHEQVMMHALMKRIIIGGVF
ncbi:MAG: cobalamin-dependent protein [Pseudomonadota bacterium]